MEKTSSRRDFLLTTLGTGFGTGFALAVKPVVAQTLIRTSSEGLLAGGVEIKNGANTVLAYRAQPATVKKSTSLPIVLVVSEIFGVHEHIADICRRLAKEGYLAIAPEIFTRWGDAKSYSDIPKLMEEVISKAEDELILGDLDSCAKWAVQQGGDAKRMAITGFCFGGRLTWLYAARNSQLKAAVAWYGRLEGMEKTQTPQHPIDIAANLYAPVLGLYGGADTGIPVSSVEKMRTALAKGNAQSKASVIKVYEGAPHAFNADYRPNYRADVATDAWEKMLAWYRKYGV